MNLKEPSRKKRSRQPYQRPFPIPPSKNEEWVMYTAHLSASGTCIAHPDEMAAVYCMGYFGKGLLSRGFPSFGKRQFGVPPQVRERQWKRRKRWLDDVKKLETAPTGTSTEPSEKVVADEEDVKCSSVSSKPLRDGTAPGDLDRDASKRGDKFAEVVGHKEKDLKNEPKIEEDHFDPETSGASATSTEEVPKIPKTDKKEEGHSENEEASSGFGVKCEKKNTKCLEKFSDSSGTTNLSITAVKTEEKISVPTHNETTSVDVKNSTDSQINRKSKSKSSETRETNGSTEQSTSVENSCKTEHKNSGNHSLETKISDQSLGEPKYPEDPSESNSKCKETRAEALNSETSIIKSSNTDGQPPAEASTNREKLAQSSETTPQTLEDQKEIDEVILESTEDEEVLEIIDASKSMETESQGDDICVVHDDMEPDNFMDFMTPPPEKPNVNPNEMLVLPDSDSDAENYLRTMVPRVETEGFPVAETLQLTFEETFFLMFGLGCLQVVNYEGNFFSIVEAWKHFNQQDEDFFSKYVVYHYFRSKGWVVKPGLKCSGDFVLYKKGPHFYHASYVVYIEVVDADNLLRDDSKMKRDSSWLNIHSLNRLAQSVAKELLIAQVLWPSTIPKNSDPVPLEALPEFTVRELLMRRWNPNETCEIIPSDDDEDEDSDDDDSS
ncbi:tRNA-splicing endonuclease subunit Sen2 [Diachasmimorpha longicaudata]|uniref:tRNA-splicing endonuclease subunit Sen2 n=1 Tax=Diachasmimorpha longicaudata TaxID=58733 RepID=UPI0030B91155